MSNLIVTLLLCAILKAIKPEIPTEAAYIVIFAAAVIDTVRLTTWRTK